MSLFAQDYGAESTAASPAGSPFAPDHDIQLLLPASVTRSLAKRLFFDIRDALFPENFPLLQLTSRPVDTGMLLGDIVSLPWYRTIFTNVGNVIAPETLPPLELESRPVDVGELISDQMSHQWWSSLLRNLADRIAPERMPPLQLTSRPFDASLQDGSVQVVRWSSTISLPRVPVSARQFVTNEPLKPRIHRAPLAPQLAGIAVAQSPVPNDPAPANMHAAHGAKLRGKLSRSRVREAILISVAVLEALYLAASFFGLA
jgi:hypothetical protein